MQKLLLLNGQLLFLFSSFSVRFSMLLILKITTKSNCRNSGDKTFKTKLQPKIHELTTHYNDIIEKIGYLPGKRLTRMEIQ